MDDFLKSVNSKERRRLGLLINAITEQKMMLSQILSRYGEKNPEGILKRIIAGDLEEHPAYEDYLSATVLTSEIQKMRERCKQLMETL